MKKIDKLILGSFLGPFFLTFFVVIFILLSQFMLKYFDEIVGKDLDFSVILELIFYFSIYMTPNAFPLAILLSALMTFGNLGQHFELTALKGAGISLIRVMMPIFVFSVLLTVVAYFSNNYIVPKANLKAFSLLYDVKQMKPSMELKAGSFYNGIDGYSIKVGKKFPDGITLKDIIIYDHTAGRGNKAVTLADSGKMYNILNDRYLVLELFNGYTYREERPAKRRYSPYKKPDPLIRNEFKFQKIVLSLAAFDLKRTKEELFASNRLMKNAQQLKVDVDSMKLDYIDKREEVKEHSFRFFDYHLQDLVGVYKQRALERERKQQEEQRRREAELEKKQKKALGDSTLPASAGITLEKGLGKSSGSSKMLEDSIKNLQRKFNTKSITGIDKKSIKKSLAARKKSNLTAGITPKYYKKQKQDSIARTRTHEETMAIIDSLLNKPYLVEKAYKKALTHVRYVKNHMSMRNNQLENLKTEINKFSLERYRKMSYAVTILIMFFIGAPLGAIIKRGGLGVPVLISMSFFILFYVITMICEKWTRSGVMDPFLAAWMANIILFPIGMFFMYQAKNDVRLFDMDFYNVLFINLSKKLYSLKTKFLKTKHLN